MEIYITFHVEFSKESTTTYLLKPSNQLKIKTSKKNISYNLLHYCSISDSQYLFFQNNNILQLSQRKGKRTHSSILHLYTKLYYFSKIASRKAIFFTCDDIPCVFTSRLCIHTHTYEYIYENIKALSLFYFYFI